MERYAWKATVKEGMLEEYVRRHNEIWPELTEVLRQAGIRNYTIWNCGSELFGYYECEKGADYAAAVPGRQSGGGPVERLYEGRHGDGDGSGDRRPAPADPGVPDGMRAVEPLSFFSAGKPASR